MDSLSFRLVRPMNRLTQLALLKHFQCHPEQLTAFNAKLIQRYALLDYVDHRTMLEILTKMAKQPPTTASLIGLRQTLQAVQRFPLALEADKRAFETELLNSVLATPADTLSSVEYGALWSFTTQTTAWEDVLRLSNTFPLQSTLPLQSEREFRIVLNQMLMSAIPVALTSPVSSSMDSQPRGVRLLKELVGEETALKRAFDGIVHSDACWTERESAVFTFVGVVHALGRWPSEHIPEEKAWKQLALHPTTSHDVDLHQLLRVLVRVYSPLVPEYVRESLDEAMSTDLWRCYSELPNAPVAVFFGLGEPRLRFPDDQKTEEEHAMDRDEKTQEGLATTSQSRQMQEALRRLHERAVEKQLRSDGPPLGVSVLINLLISNTFLRVQGDLFHAIIAALKGALASPSSLRSVTPLQAAIIAACLNQVQQMLTGTHASSLTVGDTGKDMEAIARLLLPLLSYKHMKDHGSARCVSMLLCDCPCWTREWGLEEGCLNLLREHAQDGFTRAQLQRILKCDSHGLLSLPVEVKGILEKQAAEVPER
ncbi:hypothetical protein C3747_45g194 [Trypanosoma cruzi]|uniref:Uncharacterized protein n=2 Tax=Trypanosoma cruzi TaxID=5693 RepID=Q4D9S4_TRYCC|nr:hypothetical protein, conserved [Trypanosoma cruzi]EAN89284.1 hypothetical protein, conserved [Trypanosoma cruzi]PWV13131.1 hypothetical protein C3747_45g194 [Trypanosoma cruzi]|eukprot:XP_811135.1 hypothetical protein [Trypanosoma cruzi strain CL Brener]